MSPWVRDNREAFERDMLHDFCLASQAFEDQFQRFERSGSLSFPALKDMVGEPTNKGLLWRLKDTAHLLFRDQEYVDYSPERVLLDWTLGYIFHESVKLMEDAHQCQYYVPQLARFRGQEVPPKIASLLADIQEVPSQTGESMEREVKRLKNLFRQSCRLFCLYFTKAAGHRPLARLLYGKNDLVRRVFRDYYDEFIDAVYEEEPERMFLEAAQSFMESARHAEAAEAVGKALAVNPHSKNALALQKEINDQYAQAGEGLALPKTREYS